MARKVALSLISPANKNARGHKMFLKRKQKSRKWTTGMGEWTSGWFIMAIYWLFVSILAQSINI
jgi:hypothetical protein